MSASDNSSAQISDKPSQQSQSVKGILRVPEGKGLKSSGSMISSIFSVSTLMGSKKADEKEPREGKPITFIFPDDSDTATTSYYNYTDSTSDTQHTTQSESADQPTHQHNKKSTKQKRRENPPPARQLKPKVKFCLLISGLVVFAIILIIVAIVTGPKSSNDRDSSPPPTQPTRTVPTTTQRPCPAGPTWVSGPDDYCYKLFTNQLTWTEAVAACQQEGANLTTSKNQEINDFLTTLIGDADNIWLWAQNYKWMDDNSKFTFTNFAVPDDPQNKIYCLSMFGQNNAQDKEAGKWVTELCNYPHPFYDTFKNYVCVQRSQDL